MNRAEVEKLVRGEALLVDFVDQPFVWASFERLFQWGPREDDWTVELSGPGVGWPYSMAPWRVITFGKWLEIKLAEYGVDTVCE